MFQPDVLVVFRAKVKMTRASGLNVGESCFPLNWSFREPPSSIIDVLNAITCIVSWNEMCHVKSLYAYNSYTPVPLCIWQNHLEVTQGLSWLTVDQALPRTGVPLKTLLANSFVEHITGMRVVMTGEICLQMLSCTITKEEHWRVFGENDPMKINIINSGLLKFQRNSVWERRWKQTPNTADQHKFPQWLQYLTCVTTPPKPTN